MSRFGQPLTIFEGEDVSPEISIQGGAQDPELNVLNLKNKNKVLVQYDRDIKQVEHGTRTVITLAGLMLLSMNPVENLMLQSLPKHMLQSRRTFVSLVKSKTPEMIELGWKLMEAIMSPRTQHDFLKVCDVYNWGTEGSNTYNAADKKFRERMNKKIKWSLVEGSKFLKVYSVGDETTNNLETARWIASLRDSASPWMKYEFITFCPQHEYGVLTVEEQQVLAQNAAKDTRLMTVKEQLRRSKQR